MPHKMCKHSVHDLMAFHALRQMWAFQHWHECDLLPFEPVMVAIAYHYLVINLQPMIMMEKGKSNPACTESAVQPHEDVE